MGMKITCEDCKGLGLIEWKSEKYGLVPEECWYCGALGYITMYQNIVVALEAMHRSLNKNN